MANGLGQTQLEKIGGAFSSQQLGGALQGFSAGIAGQLPQFQQAQNQKQQLQMQQQRQQQAQQKQQQEMEQARQQAAYTDAQAALSLLDDKNFDALRDFGLSRLRSLQQFPGADPSDTQRLFKLSIAAGKGNKEAERLLRNELKSIVAQGEALGLLQDPASKKRQNLFRIDEQGNTTSIFGDTEGNHFDLKGNPIELGLNDRLVPATSLQGNTDDLGLGASERGKLIAGEASALGVNQSVADLQKMLADSPDLNTMTAQVAGVINGLKAEVMAFSRALGADINTDVLDISQHEETFSELGITNARAKSALVNLAYSVAQANNPDGRISGPDFKFALQEIGAGASDPVTFSAILGDVARRSERSFRNRWQASTGRAFEGDLQSLGSTTQPSQVQTSGAQEGDLADGPNGEVVKLVNGQWVPQ